MIQKYTYIKYTEFYSNFSRFQISKSTKIDNFDKISKSLYEIPRIADPLHSTVKLGLHEHMGILADPVIYDNIVVYTYVNLFIVQATV